MRADRCLREELTLHGIDEIIAELVAMGRIEEVGPFICRYHGGVDWCERDKPDRVPVYRVATNPDKG